MLERSSEYRAGFLQSRHSLLTRWAHVALASTIIIQLLTSLVMVGPRRGRPGDLLFTVHEIFGICALAFAFAFWCVVAARRRGTSVAMLFPGYRRAASPTSGVTVSTISPRSCGFAFPITRRSCRSPRRCTASGFC